MLLSGDQSEIFGEAEPEPREIKRPLSVRMRPRRLEEIVGQQHIVGEGTLLPRLILADNFGSLMFYGPPGCGKTSIAEVIAQETESKRPN